LRDQVSLLELTPRQTLLADEFIGNINDDGYLACGVEDIVRALNEIVTKAAEDAGRDTEDLPLYTIEEGLKMLSTVQTLDPPGVGAQNLRECLLLQLKESGLEQSVPYRLVRDCFEELINHRWSEISKRFGISATDVQKAADEIAKLDPKPGLQYGSRDDNYIIPDLIVEKIDDRYHVFLNDANLPRLKLSRAYQEIARDKNGYILTGRDAKDCEAWPLERPPYLLETSAPGVFACGDVRHGSVKRVASGVGEGSMAIAFIHQYVRETPHEAALR